MAKCMKFVVLHFTRQRCLLFGVTSEIVTGNMSNKAHISMSSDFLINWPEEEKFSTHKYHISVYIL